MDYAEARALIQSGDVIFQSHKPLRSWYDLQIWLLRAFTRSEWGHVGLAWVVGVEVANGMDEPARTQTLAGLNSIWWGVGISNVLILISASNPVGLIAGAMAGLGWWASTVDQRAFAEVCARERLSNPRLICTYTTPA